MNRLNSGHTLIIWIYCVTATVLTSAGMFFFRGAVPAIVIGAVMIISVTAFIVCEGKSVPGKTAGIILWLAAAAGTVFGGNPFSGLTGLVPSSIPSFIGRKIRIALAFVFSAAGCTIWILTSEHTRKETVIYPLIVGALYVLWIVSVNVIAGYERNEERLAEALRTSSLDSLSERKLREELARQSETNRMNARLEERERISRDIHNSVGHTLAAASVTLDAAQLLVGEDDELAASRMKQANERVREAMDSIRSAVRTLDSDDDSVGLSDYAASLNEMARKFEMDTGVKIHRNFDMIKEEKRIPLNIAALMSGALAEALTNGVKHGGATVFVAVLSCSSDNILLKVQDNGTGFGDADQEERDSLLAKGFGIRKTMDKVRSVGGNMEIDGSDGFSIKLTLPLIPGKE